ncbi:MAG: LysM peptidoglycan-binding domain-containing protein [Clostridia bacterium]
MTMINQPAAPGVGPEGFPTPSLPDNQPAAPGNGPELFPTPSLPEHQPAQPGPGPIGFPTPALPSQPIIRRCPYGYRAATVQNNQTFSDLLLENNVSYQAMRNANPSLPTTRIAPGTRYCAPPPVSRKLCENGTSTYIMEQGESLSTLARSIGIVPGMLLVSNPTLAPSDFVPGRVICIP